MIRHPAKFSEPVLEKVVDMLDDWGWPKRILDPFAGTGRVHQLVGPRVVGDTIEARVGVETVGVEIEPEWAEMHPRTLVANALQLPFPDDSFDAMITSPCLAQDHRLLTNDLRWVPAGEVEVDDEVLAFDEYPENSASRGLGTRRRWRRAVVVRSEPKRVDCVRVILANGDEIVTTPEHPWLAYRRAYRDRRAEWIQSRDLMPNAWVMLQCRPWTERNTFGAGWLAGMFDGEGSLSLGVHGCPKLCIYQCEGEVADLVEQLMDEFGYEPNRIVRKGTPKHYRKVANLYVTGGFPTMLRALGELTPVRLMNKWENLDISTRTIQAEKVQVVAVEPAGRRDIQEIETSTGTYFGEGYLMHNCYGNRLADHHNAQDGSRRYSYRHVLGRELHEDNSGQMQWGDRYRNMHRAAWDEVLRVLAPDSLIIINCSNHIRGGVEQNVTEFHLQHFLNRGCAVLDLDVVNTARLRHGANRDVRPRYENVIALRYVAPVYTPDEEDDDDAIDAPVGPGLADHVDAGAGSGST